MIDVESARRVILAACPVLAPVDVPLGEALGCVTASPVVAAHDVPSFTNSAMDGYAVLAADTVAAPVVLDVVGTAAAGAPPGVEVGPGRAVRIMTGAVLPAGADAVVMVERTVPVDGGRVRIEAAASPGDHLRHPGEDLQAGQVMFVEGTELGPGHIGVLASVGASTVDVVPRPRVGVLSTGDELVADGRPLRPGQIRDSNRPMLLALVARAGCVPVDLGTAPDDEAAITDALERGVAGCDAVLTSGGVSVGDFDYVKIVLDRLGEMHWWQVAVRPAKPLAFGTVRGTPVFGLPGNPVSALVSFELFARPALRQMAGHRDLFRPEVPAVADEALVRRPDGKLHLVRVVASSDEDGRLHVRSSGGQGSHLLRAMALANALAVLPDGDGVDIGGTVQVLLLA
ncbi:MAG TPA: gephyrin-like molybdotransferase Glp [Acidimicrobiales bacterium]|nr:gephyrin-like molybdotransferase Glp [Acidimicrobiales bacterium]